MSDAGWAALAAIVASVCGLLSAIFAKQGLNQGRRNEEKILEHEEASATRSADLKAQMPGPGPGRNVLGD